MNRPSQKGWSFIEALLVAALLGGGWIGIQQLITQGHNQALWLTRQTEAQNLADNRIECLRARLTDCSAPPTEWQGARYQLEMESADGLLQVTVQWSGPGASDKAQWSAVSYLGQVPAALSIP